MPINTSEFSFKFTDNGIVYFEGQLHRNDHRNLSSRSQISNRLFEVSDKVVHEIMCVLQWLPLPILVAMRRGQ